MKKTRIIAAVLAAVTVAALVLSFNVSAEILSADIGTKTDVLDNPDLCALFNSHNNSFYPVPELNDGKYFSNAGEKVYFNKSHCAKGEAVDVEAAGGEFEVTLTDGKTAKYLYTFEYSELNANVDSFALYFNNEKPYAGDDEHFADWHIDSAFEILVSQDGGNTYTVAWKSEPLVISADGTKVESCAAFLKEEGGNTTEVKLKDAAGTVNCTYRYIAENFDKEYKNVTNILYGCINCRRNSAGEPTAATPEPFYYAVRMTEFDVYGSVNAAAETEPETQAPETQAPETEPAAPETQAPETEPAAPETQAPETQAPETQAPETKAPETEKKEEKGGCASSAAIGIAVVVTVLGTALLRKKD